MTSDAVLEMRDHSFTNLHSHDTKYVHTS